MNSIKKYIKILRLGEVFLMSGFPLIGTIFSFTEVSIESLLKICFFSFSTFLMFLSIYTLNSWCGYYYDIDNTRLSYMKNIRPGNLLILCIIFMFLSSALYLIISFKLFIMGIICIFLWLSYSFPKIGLKHVPLAGTILHFLAQIIHFQMGYSLFQNISIQSILISMYFSLLFSAGHLHHEIIDFEADKKACIKTGAVFFGKDKILKISSSLFFISAMYLFALYEWKVLQYVELIIFITAYIMQVITQIYLKINMYSEYKMYLKYRTLYRVYYLLAGLSCGLIKCILIL
ncbi:MAG: UbiA family prenyltransferase [Candidatus Eremiobacterota bacterium]